MNIIESEPSKFGSSRDGKMQLWIIQQVEKFLGKLVRIPGNTGKHHPGFRNWPASYVVNARDLRTKNPQNKLVKFADDTYLIVPSSMEETRMEEISNISEWATQNNLTLNNSKTVEIGNLLKTKKQTSNHTTRPDPWNRTFSVDEDVGSHDIQHILRISTYRGDSVHLCSCTVCS